MGSGRYMSTTEQRRLIVAWRIDGDSSARDKLIAGMASLVTLRVQQLSGRKPLDPDMRQDLVSEGIVGMVEGVEKYDLSRLDSTAPWSYCAHWVDLRIRQAMVRLIPAVSYRNYMAWWRCGVDRKLEPGDAFDTARTEDDLPLTQTLASEALTPLELLEEAERPAESWEALRAVVPDVPQEEWDLFALRYRQTWPYWSERDADRVPRRVLSRILQVRGTRDALGATLAKLRKILADDVLPEAPPPPPPTSTSTWNLSPAPPAAPKTRRRPKDDLP